MEHASKPDTERANKIDVRSDFITIWSGTFEHTNSSHILKILRACAECGDWNWELWRNQLENRLSKLPQNAVEDGRVSISVGCFFFQNCSVRPVPCAVFANAEQKMIIGNDSYISFAREFGVNPVPVWCLSQHQRHTLSSFICNVRRSLSALGRFRPMIARLPHILAEFSLAALAARHSTPAIIFAFCFESTAKVFRKQKLFQYMN